MISFFVTFENYVFLEELRDPLNPIFQRQMKTILSQHRNITLPPLLLVREKVGQSLMWTMDRESWHNGLEIPPISNTDLPDVPVLPAVTGFYIQRNHFIP